MPGGTDLDAKVPGLGPSLKPTPLETAKNKCMRCHDGSDGPELNLNNPSVAISYLDKRKVDMEGRANLEREEKTEIEAFFNKIADR